MNHRLLAAAIVLFISIFVLPVLLLTLVVALVYPDCKWFRNLLIAWDQLGNSAILGDPDETISSRCGKRTNPICIWVCKTLDKVDKDHCFDAIETDEGKDELY